MGKYLPSELQTESFIYPATAYIGAGFDLTAVQAAAADDDALLSFTLGTSAVLKFVMSAQPPYPRNITIASSGTAGNIAAGTITVTGEDIAGSVITEDFTVTADTAINATGSKAFKHVLAVSFPAMDGDVGIKVGFGDLYGLPYKLDSTPLCIGSVDGTQETVTLTVDDDELAKNTFTFSSAPAGETVKIIIFV